MQLLLCIVLMIMPSACVLVGAAIHLSYRMRPPRRYTRWSMGSSRELPTVAE